MDNKRSGLYWTHAVRYTRGDCVKFFKEFYAEHGRFPQTKDIQEAAKKRLCPSAGIFSKFTIAAIKEVAEAEMREAEKPGEITGS